MMDIKKLNVIARAFLQDYIDSMFDLNETSDCGFSAYADGDGIFWFKFKGEEKRIHIENINACPAGDFFKAAVNFDVDKYSIAAVERQIERQSSYFSMERLQREAADYLARLVGLGFAFALFGGNKMFQKHGFSFKRVGDPVNSGAMIRISLPYRLSYTGFAKFFEISDFGLAIGKLTIPDEKKFSILKDILRQNGDVPFAQALAAREFANSSLWAIVSAVAVASGNIPEHADVSKELKKIAKEFHEEFGESPTS